MTFEKISKYCIIDEIGYIADKDYRASMNAIQPYIDTLTDCEIWQMADFVSEQVWNGNGEAPRTLDYIVRRDFNPSNVIIVCYEMNKSVERALDTWYEHVDTHISLYVRASRRFIKDYSSQWDSLTIDTYEDYNTDRRFVNKWYRPLGIVLSAPPLSDYQPDNDITGYGKRHIDYRVSDNHTTRPTTTAIKYHLNQTAIASKKEIATAKQQIEWTLKQVDLGQIYPADALAPNWYFCPYCGEPTYNSETSHTIEADGVKVTCGQLKNECNECHRKFKFNRFNRPIKL